MDAILDIDADSGVVTCEAGVVLERLAEALAPHGLVPPIDLGAKGSCQLGGIASTNAGGLRFCRFGSLLGNVTGLEVVRADGEVLDLMNVCRKDNTGYPLRQLFLGAEGTLGVITKVALAAAPKPESVQVAFLACASLDAVLGALRLAKRRVGEILSAFELVDAVALQSVAALPQVDADRLGLSLRQPYYVLLETYGSDAGRDQAALGAFLEEALAAESVEDGVLAQDETQASELWRLRELCPTAAAASGYVYKYDLSLPLRSWEAFTEECRGRMEPYPDARVHVWGHAVDGNIHLNIVTPEAREDVRTALEPWVYDYVAKRGGSISAEHGIGVLKLGAFQNTKAAAAQETMSAVKKLLDPNAILNPGKILRG